MGKRRKTQHEDKFSYHINEGRLGSFLSAETVLQTIELKPLKVSITENLINHGFRPHLTLIIIQV